MCEAMFGLVGWLALAVRSGIVKISVRVGMNGIRINRLVLAQLLLEF